MPKRPEELQPPRREIIDNIDFLELIKDLLSNLQDPLVNSHVVNHPNKLSLLLEELGIEVRTSELSSNDYIAILVNLYLIHVLKSFDINKYSSKDIFKMLTDPIETYENYLESNDFGPITIKKSQNPLKRRLYRFIKNNRADELNIDLVIIHNLNRVVKECYISNSVDSNIFLFQLAILAIESMDGHKYDSNLNQIGYIMDGMRIDSPPKNISYALFSVKAVNAIQAWDRNIAKPIENKKKEVFLLINKLSELHKKLENKKGVAKRRARTSTRKQAVTEARRIHIESTGRKTHSPPPAPSNHDSSLPKIEVEINKTWNAIKELMSEIVSLKDVELSIDNVFTWTFVYS